MRPLLGSRAMGEAACWHPLEKIYHTGGGLQCRCGFQPHVSDMLSMFDENGPILSRPRAKIHDWSVLARVEKCRFPDGRVSYRGSLENVHAAIDADGVKCGDTVRYIEDDDWLPGQVPKRAEPFTTTVFNLDPPYPDVVREADPLESRLAAVEERLKGVERYVRPLIPRVPCKNCRRLPEHHWAWERCDAGDPGRKYEPED